MGKSPGKWIKTVIFGKKSSKSNLSKDATIDKKTSTNGKPPLKDFDDDSMVISSPVPMHEPKKTNNINLTRDTIEVVRSNFLLHAVDDDELIKLEQAATIAQAVFRGFKARRAFWALKGITRLQAHIRGHLVRRQAVATLICMRAIVEFQALTRGVIVRLSIDNRHMHQKHAQRQLVDKKRINLLEQSLQSEKLSTNAFVIKLVASSQTTMPLSIQYDPTEPNSATNWLDRWSTSRFWEPLPKPKKYLNIKPIRKQMKSHEETEPVRPKRNARAPNLGGRFVNSPENKKPNPTLKVSSQQTQSVQEQSYSELEKVKLSLRKISISTVGPSEKPKIVTEKPERVAEKPEKTEKQEISLDKASESPNLSVFDQGTDQFFEKINEEMTVLPLPEPPLVENKIKPYIPLQDDDDHLAEIDPSVINGKVINYIKENQKARRRKSFPVKEDHHPESVFKIAPALPSYMVATESAKAKLRPQAVEDGPENGFFRRYSLPSKLSLQSPRVQKPLQVNVNGWTKTKSNKCQISGRDDKMIQTGWKR